MVRFRNALDSFKCVVLCVWWTACEILLHLCVVCVGSVLDVFSCVVLFV